MPRDSSDVYTLPFTLTADKIAQIPFTSERTDQVLQDLAAGITGTATKTELATEAALARNGANLTAGSVADIAISGLSASKLIGVVPVANLPSYVHAIQNYSTLAAFPAVGTADIIYVADDTNVSYRWTGSAYIGVGSAGGGGTTDASLLTTGTLNSARLPTSGVAANTYTNATVTVDAVGRVTSAASGATVVPFNGGLITNDLQIYKLNPAVTFTKSASGGSNQILGYTVASARWSLLIGDNQPESGGNFGSNFGLTRYDDNGISISQSFNINRKTGYWTIEAPGLESIATGLVSDPTALATLKGSVTQTPWSGTGPIPVGLTVMHNSTAGTSLNAAILGQQVNAASTPLYVPNEISGTPVATINYGIWIFMGHTGSQPGYSGQMCIMYRYQ